jgi:hypothetical protein
MLLILDFTSYGHQISGLQIRELPGLVVDEHLTRLIEEDGNVLPRRIGHYELVFIAINSFHFALGFICHGGKRQAKKERHDEHSEEYSREANHGNSPEGWKKEPQPDYGRPALAAAVKCEMKRITRYDDEKHRSRPAIDVAAPA